MRWKSSDRFMEKTELLTIAFVVLAFSGLTFLLILKDFSLKSPCMNTNYDQGRQLLYIVMEDNNTHSQISGRLSDASQNSSFFVYNWSDEQSITDINELAKRQRNLISAFIISRILNRNFRILDKSSCRLGNYLEENLIEWKINKSTFHLNSHMDKTDVVYFQERDNSFEKMYGIENIGKTVPWVTKNHIADVFRVVTMSLFKPSRDLESTVQRFYTNKARNRKLVCAKINRTNAVDNEVLLKFLSSYKYGDNGIFVVTESSETTSFLRNYFGPYFVEHLNATDIDNDICDRQRLSFIQYIVLSQCTTLVITNDTTSISAAYLRKDSKDLYCMISDQIVPCSRYNLSHFYK